MKNIEAKGLKIINEIEQIKNSIDNFYELLKKDESFKVGIKKAVDVILNNCFKEFSRQINANISDSLNQAVSNFEKSSSLSTEVRNIVRKSVLGDEFPISLIADTESKMINFIKDKINENIGESLAGFKDNLNQSFEAVHVLRRGINKKGSNSKRFGQFKSSNITREEIREQFGNVAVNLSESLNNLEKIFDAIAKDIVIFDDDTLNEMGNIFINNVQMQIQILQKDLQYSIVSKTIDIDETLKKNTDDILKIQKFIKDEIEITISKDIIDKLNREMSILMDFSSSKILSNIKEKLTDSLKYIEEYINVSIKEYIEFYKRTLNYIIEKSKKDIFIFEKCLGETESTNKILKSYDGIKMEKRLKLYIIGKSSNLIEIFKESPYVEIVDLEEDVKIDYIIYAVENYDEDFKKEKILEIYERMQKGFNKVDMSEFIWFLKDTEEYDKIKSDIKKLDLQKSHAIFFMPTNVENILNLDETYILALCFKNKIKKYVEDAKFYEEAENKILNMDIFTEEKLNTKLNSPNEMVVKCLEDLAQTPRIDYKKLKKEIKKALEFKKLRNIVNDEKTDASLRKIFNMWIEDIEGVIDEIAKNSDCGNKFFFDESKFKVNVKYILSDFRNDLEKNEEWQIIFCFVKSAIFLNAFYSKNLSRYYTDGIKCVGLRAVREDLKQLEEFIENY